MKILLIQPEYKDTWASPPIGLGYVAASLENDGHKVFFIDLTKDPLSDENFLKYINNINPECIGISLMCRALPEVKRVVAIIRKSTDIPIFIGGPQPTVLPDFTLEYTGADFAVIGEGEITTKELIQNIEGGRNFNQIDGIAFHDNGQIKINRPRELINELDQILFPAWHLMPPSEYRITPVLASAKRYPIAPIISTRGCPYKCSFCGGPIIWNKTFRMRSPENIVDEIEILMERYGVREIFFSDDNFTLNKKHAMGVCKEILDRKIDISWACPNGVRIDRLDRELLQIMKKSGCHLLGFGIESGSQEILNNASKHLELKLVTEIVKEAKQTGMTTYGFFIIGLPGENSQTIRQTINLAKSLPLDRAWFNILVPYPGTEIFNTFTENISLNDVDWSGIDASTAMISSGIKYKDLTGEDLVSFQKKAIKEFYLRPNIIIDVLKNTNYNSLKTMIKTSFFKHLIFKNLENKSDKSKSISVK